LKCGSPSRPLGLGQDRIAKIDPLGYPWVVSKIRSKRLVLLVGRLRDDLPFGKLLSRKHPNGGRRAQAHFRC
jgi:hypothetical protein